MRFILDALQSKNVALFVLKSSLTHSVKLFSVRGRVLDFGNTVENKMGGIICSPQLVCFNYL